MPVDFEMMLSSTRSSVLSYLPFADDRFSLTSGYDDSDYDTSFNVTKNHYLLRSNSRRYGFIQNRPVFSQFENGTHIKSKTKTNSCDVFQDGARKKKVSFADDKGLNLVEVREIPGAPKWSDDVLALLTGENKRNVVNENKWKLAFEHPPWEDEKLIAFLEQNSVVLESVNVIKGSEDTFNGTIKVKNLVYEKNVFCRITFDRWVSFFDVKANYMKPKAKLSTKSDKYDTFYFSTKITSSALRYEVIEFCICFQCNDDEYWDNNGGINYRLVVDSSSKNSKSLPKSDKDKLSESKITLSLTENIEKFSEIDSWSNFMYNQPYW